MSIERFPDDTRFPEARRSREHRQAAYNTAVVWARSFLAIDDSASLGRYREALSLIDDAAFPSDTAAKLSMALLTEDDHVIEQVFNDYKGRLGNVFCESCWNATKGVK